MNYKKKMKSLSWLISSQMLLMAGMCVQTNTVRAEENLNALPDNDILMSALKDELTRSMTLKLDDLPTPYFISYRASDWITYSLSATYGGLTSSDRSRYRNLSTRVRVGSYEFDNTNVGFGFGGGGLLPVEDNYTAIRHATWSATDEDYKRAVEFYTRKEAYMKTIKVDEDRPDNYTPGKAVTHIEPSAEVDFDKSKWEDRIRLLSKEFDKHPEIMDSDVSMSALGRNQILVNTENTKIRISDTIAYLSAQAEIQAEDGMRLFDSFTEIANQPGDLPSMNKLKEKINKMCASLKKFSKAEIPDSYSGPVLFTPKAAAVVFDSMLADGMAARPIPLGGRSSPASLEQKIGQRILPKEFTIIDDPNITEFEGEIMLGTYRYDDEGTKPERVTLVEKGKLKTLVSGRAPTKKIKQSTGHAVSSGFGDAAASVMNLFINAEDGMTEEELKQELITAAQDEGLDYAIKIDALYGGSYSRLGRPIKAYKVFVEDGREVPIRGVEFLPVSRRSLKRLLGWGDKPEVYHSMGGVVRSIVAPAILFDELELTRIQRDEDRLPYLPSPLQRNAGSPGKNPESEGTN